MDVDGNDLSNRSIAVRVPRWTVPAESHDFTMMGFHDHDRAFIVKPSLPPLPAAVCIESREICRRHEPVVGRAPRRDVGGCDRDRIFNPGVTTTNESAVQYQG